MSTRKRDLHIPTWLGVLMTAYGAAASVALVVLYTKAASTTGTANVIGASWAAAVTVAVIVTATMIAGIRLVNSRLAPISDSRRRR
ncbi:hypothetical protein HH308_23260 [Gordonia sp. TBRC 11910]|uniref:Uncharacterized protein n=1 Tax=Gordonia asplenii TaxID=2725283 RepID=A0A848L0C5_9ACTN|nr:hypothetical protein [Gordonia asplenii]NMO04139.1 hypothetical protein [Gordonia asplenii]